jgi:hypothetical protein
MLPKFRKLWGRIDTKLYAGDVLQMEVANRYNTYLFDGEKHIVLGTTSWLGGKNRLAGALLVFLGCITATFCGLFIWIHLDPNTREFGDMVRTPFSNPAHLGSLPPCCPSFLGVWVRATQDLPVR